MRLVIFIKSLSGGAGKATTQYAQILSELGFSVTLVVGSADTKLSTLLPEAVSFEVLGMRGRVPPVISLSAALQRVRPHISLVIGMGNGLPLHLALRLAGQTSIVIHREVNAPHAVLGQHYWFRRGIETLMARLAYKHADHIICLTRAMYKELHEEWHIPTWKLNFIPNGVRIPTGNLIQRDLTNPPTILYVGRLTRQKDVPTLLNAFAMLRERQNCRLKIAGDGKERAKLEALSVELGIASDVTFLGHVANPVPLYHQAHCTVLSSLFEGFPNTLIESLAQGCPVVATDCPTGPAEIVDSDEVGYLAPMCDPRELANQLERAIQRDFDTDKLRARAETFSEERLKIRIRKLSEKVFQQLESRDNENSSKNSKRPTLSF